MGKHCLDRYFHVLFLFDFIRKECAVEPVQVFVMGGAIPRKRSSNIATRDNQSITP
jgi:hypothetical protein